MSREHAALLLARNEELEKRQEKFTALLIQHDAELTALLETLPKLRADVLAQALPEVGKEIAAKLESSIPDLVSARVGEVSTELASIHEAAVNDAATKLEAIRNEIASLAVEKFTEAEKQRLLSFEEIEARLNEKTTGKIADVERGLLLKIQQELAANIQPPAEPAKAPSLIDSYRGALKEGVAVNRGDLWTWIGTTYLALEDNAETPNRSNVGGKLPKWAIFAARGAGGGGGGSGGSDLPSPIGQTGKFVKSDGTTYVLANIPGGGDMLGANNLSDVASAPTAFATIKQAATTSATGVVELATDGEVAPNVVVQGNDSRLADARTPTAHATSHQSGGGDAIKLDDLAAPDDNTDLNVSTSKHGLFPKLPNNTVSFYRADGTWVAPTALATWGSVTGTLSDQLDLQAALDAKVPVSRTINSRPLTANITITKADVGLGSVTDDAQTKAAIVPNTAPSSGQLLAGNAGGTAYAPVSMSGDAIIGTTGVITVTKTGGVSFAAVATSGAKADVGLGNVDNTSNATERAATATLTNKTISAAIFSGINSLSPNAVFQLPTGLADGQFAGISITGTAGTALSFGDLCYLAVADSRWEKTDADAEATAGPVKVRICISAAAADGDPTKLLEWGVIRADSKFPTMTVAAPVYISVTPGEINSAQPSGTDDVIRIIGEAHTADELFFNPERSWMTHT